MLAQLTIATLRNISDMSIEPDPNINLIVGNNGSGKTSLLESIHLLALGRSFRTNTLKYIIQFGQQQSRIIAKTDMGIPIGLQIDVNTGLTIRANNAPLKKISELANQLPLQLIPANCHQFFEQGPRYRRQLIDWGLFHVEPEFNYHWQSYRKILQQRNAAIRQRKNINEIQLWDGQLVAHAEKISDYREQQLVALLAEFEVLFPQLCPEFDSATFSLRYQHGWSKDKPLADLLVLSIETDQKLGYTRLGSHAADWSFKINDMDPSHLLSRGQQKAFYLALCMAQAELKQKATQANSLLLLDDISSELDTHHQQRVLTILSSLPTQTFITSTNPLPAKDTMRMFHVEQGHII